MRYLLEIAVCCSSDRSSGGCNVVSARIGLGINVSIQCGGRDIKLLAANTNS